jgi:hypothetical protein
MRGPGPRTAPRQGSGPGLAREAREETPASEAAEASGGFGRRAGAWRGAGSAGVGWGWPRSLPGAMPVSALGRSAKAMPVACPPGTLSDTQRWDREMSLKEGKPVGGAMRMSDPSRRKAAVVKARGLNREAGQCCAGQGSAPAGCAGGPRARREFAGGERGRGPAPRSGRADGTSPEPVEGWERAASPPPPIPEQRLGEPAARARVWPAKPAGAPAT